MESKSAICVTGLIVERRDRMSAESERRRQKRRKFTYYMPVLDASTLQPIGYLSDISLTGIRMDSEKPLKVNANYKLRVDVTPDLANRNYVLFDGISRWCEVDKLSPGSYFVGFEVRLPSNSDREIFERMYEQYGVDIRV